MTQARNLGNVGDAISGSSNTNVSFDSNLLYIDSINNKIGVKTSSPTENLDITGNTSISGYISATSLAVTSNTSTGNVSTGTIALSSINSSSDLTLKTNSGANTTQFLSNGTLVLSNALSFPDGTSQLTKASGGLNTGVTQTVTATANTAVNLSLGDVVDINMATDIVNLSFTNANQYQIVLVNLIMDSNTRTLSSIANCSSSVVIGYKDTVFSFQLFTVNSGANWAYSFVGNNRDSSRKSLWNWGNNYYGELGQNDRTHRSSPVQVGSLTTWSQVAGGGHNSLALKTDGTLWSWGWNTYGQLGQNDITMRSSPTQVGSLTNWSQIACGRNHSLAIKTDGTLWSWGHNAYYGKLGQNDRTHRSSPTQVGSLTNWSLVAGGWYHSLALKTDGTIWSWGYNNNGQLGQNDITHRSSPVQVGSLTTWSLVAGGREHPLAIKTDGTLWSWGYNAYGQLGQNDRTTRSSPTQVGTLTTWSQVAGGNYHSLAIQSY